MGIGNIFFSVFRIPRGVPLGYRSNWGKGKKEGEVSRCCRIVIPGTKAAPCFV